MKHSSVSCCSLPYSPTVFVHFSPHFCMLLPPLHGAKCLLADTVPRLQGCNPQLFFFFTNRGEGILRCLLWSRNWKYTPNVRPMQWNRVPTIELPLQYSILIFLWSLRRCRSEMPWYDKFNSQHYFPKQIHNLL